MLLPLLAETAEACGGFDWDDSAFDRVCSAFEASLFGSRRAYGAIAPLVGVSVGTVVDLGGGLRVRHGFGRAGCALAAGRRPASGRV